MRWAKPIDTDLLREVAASHSALVTVEEGCVVGGAGSAVAEALADLGVSLPVLHLGVPDRFTEHGDPQALLAEMGLDAAGIERSVRARWPGLLPAQA
jgi:1-deoxy-D-xylulose-5-phosphate synthase